MSASWCDSDDDDFQEEYDDNHPDWNLLRGCDLHIFAGPAGHERLVRVHPTYHPYREEKVVYYYKGPKGRERLVWETIDESARGSCVKYYEGTKDQEHLVRQETQPNPNRRSCGHPNEIKYYKGPKDKERLVCKYDWDLGTTKHYEGPKGRECKVRCEMPEGRVYHYVKEWRGYEPAVLARTEHPDGTVDVYDGTLDGHPYRVSRIHPSGQVDHFGHPRNRCDDQFTVRTEWPDGTITHFQFRFKDREELPLVTEHPNGQVTYHGTLLPEKKGSAPGFDTWIEPLVKYKWHTRIKLRNGRVLNDASFRWVRVRRWVTKRVIALYWQERTQMRLAAPDGAGRRADRVAYEADFGA